MGKWRFFLDFNKNVLYFSRNLCCLPSLPPSPTWKKLARYDLTRKWTAYTAYYFSLLLLVMKLYKIYKGCVKILLSDLEVLVIYLVLSVSVTFCPCLLTCQLPVRSTPVHITPVSSWFACWSVRKQIFFLLFLTLAPLLKKSIVSNLCEKSTSQNYKKKYITPRTNNDFSSWVVDLIHKTENLSLQM